MEDGYVSIIIDTIMKWRLQVIDAANEVIDSIDQDELAKYFSQKSDPEDEEAEVWINVFFFFLLLALTIELLAV